GAGAACSPDSHCPRPSSGPKLTTASSGGSPGTASGSCPCSQRTPATWRCACTWRLSASTSWPAATRRGSMKWPIWLVAPITRRGMAAAVWWAGAGAAASDYSVQPRRPVRPRMNGTQLARARKRKRPARGGPSGTALRRTGSVVALGQVVVGHDLGGGPLQRLALGALALGLLDLVDQGVVDGTGGDLAQRQHGRLVVAVLVLDGGRNAMGQLAGALGGHHDQFEAVIDHFQAIFDGDTGHRGSRRLRSPLKSGEMERKCTRPVPAGARAGGASSFVLSDLRSAGGPAGSTVLVQQAADQAGMALLLLATAQAAGDEDRA